VRKGGEGSDKEGRGLTRGGGSLGKDMGNANAKNMEEKTGVI